MNSSFFLGLAFSFPVAIAANLLTPRLQRAVDNRSEARSKRRRQREGEVDAKAEFFANNQDALHSYILGIWLRTAWITTIFAVPAAAFGIGLQLASPRLLYGVIAIGWAAVSAFSLIGLLAVLNTLRPAIEMMRRVERREIAD